MSKQLKPSEIIKVKNSFVTGFNVLDKYQQNWRIEVYKAEDAKKPFLIFEADNFEGRFKTLGKALKRVDHIIYGLPLKKSTDR